MVDAARLSNADVFQAFDDGSDELALQVALTMYAGTIAGEFVRTADDRYYAADRYLSGSAPVAASDADAPTACSALPS